MDKVKPVRRQPAAKTIPRVSKPVTKTVAADFSQVVVRFKTKALRYQQECFKLLDRFKGRALIADEMGLGKSFESLLWALYRRKLPILIICPASVKTNWQRECLKHFGVRAEVLHGTRPRRGWKPVRPVVIINYDILGPWKSHLIRMRAQTVILDECHFVKSRVAARTKTTKAICKRIPHVLALSGTPIENNPVEFYPVLEMIRPKLFEGGFKGFAHRYCKPERKPWGWVFTGASRLKELNQILRREVMIRRLKVDVLKDLPSKSRQMLLIDGAAKKVKDYELAEKDFLAWIHETVGATQAKKASRAEQVTRTTYLKKLAAEVKLEGVLEWVDTFLATTDQKIVLFAVHRDILQRMKEHYGSKAVSVHGSVRGAKRQEAVDKFQNNPECRVFLGNLKAAGVGITLTAASTLGFVELGWTPGGMLQAEDRIHRISQKYPVTILYFLSAGTIEEKICKLLRKKQDMIGKALDGKEFKDRLSVFDELIKDLSK